MDTMIQVGASVDAIKEARAIIMEILRMDKSDDLLREALITFRTICNVNNTTISNCTLTNNPVTEEVKVVKKRGRRRKV
jgi:hypothetical protein